jgi:hypothetical protein
MIKTVQVVHLILEIMGQQIQEAQVRVPTQTHNTNKQLCYHIVVPEPHLVDYTFM